MRPVAPRTGAPEVTIAEEQEQYMPITVAVYHYNDGTRGLLTRIAAWVGELLVSLPFSSPDS